ncbi:penicillin-binding protein, beta-lactamase class C [Mycolicibacterium rhodesiae NBB3]|uniref:Penicillin-binding protein, beta-lactamase class C n=1 Tax=Mycolicibacterium rhodesiae (strain NBB3) TaxID=710685 RepID=G8RRM0_MYCRN|nr:serine hydrolase domain-containing protein [Mycolicibacterium rhodesiae]AEV71461.1 penicillin-binding protein, beta-lactamase class C [Mycolicibacterium rhodesiae NBB3]
MVDRVRKAIAVGVSALLVVTACSRSDEIQPPVSTAAPSTPPPVAAPPPPPPIGAPTPDMPAVSALIDDAIAAHKLPGAVVVVGHGGNVVFHRAYGDRKLPGEPGLNGSPAPAEPMTEDTIFDIASLTKVLGTATAVMQLHEQGKVQFDDPVQQYLPQFNTANDPQRAKVTVRMLLTHTSGEPGDVNLGDPWGLSKPDRAEGFHRALTNPLESAPGSAFRYSDINFILLGALLEKVTGEVEDDYVQRNVFAPLGMLDTRYLPVDKVCGPHAVRGSAVAWAPGVVPTECPEGEWNVGLLPRIAPTARDEEGRADRGENPDLDHLLRGTVQDTTARRMGGVAGHAGVFSTARDVSVFAQALLDRLAGRPSEFPLKRETLTSMTTPEQPGHSAGQVSEANAAGAVAGEYPAVAGQVLRGFGWDIDSPFSHPRGSVFPVGSFGHTGFTGTTLWMDPGSDTYVILLTNSIHTRGSPPISKLSGDVATVAAKALGLYGS